MTLHVVQWSGGISSWATAQRVAERHGTADMVLLFADVLTEDADLYRFSAQASAQLGVPVTRVSDGRTPWELFHHIRFVGNSRIAPCTAQLKIAVCRRWLEEHTSPDEAIVYVGIDGSEPGRASGIQRGWRPWRVELPMLQQPLLTKDDMLTWCAGLGVRPPRLYFPPWNLNHNNCRGFCVRAGIRQWTHMLAVDRESFLEHEREEERARTELGDVAILRDRSGGTSCPLPLRELRARIEGRTA